MNNLDKFLVKSLRKTCIKEVDYKDLDITINKIGKVVITHLKNKRFLYNFKSKIISSTRIDTSTVELQNLIQEFNKNKNEDTFKKIKHKLLYRNFMLNKILTKEGEQYLDKLKEQLLLTKKNIQKLSRLLDIFYMYNNKILGLDDIEQLIKVIND